MSQNYGEKKIVSSGFVGQHLKCRSTFEKLKNTRL